MLSVKLLSASAKAPTVAHPGEDLGYDIYSAETVTLEGRSHAIVSTGIAIECTVAGWRSRWVRCCGINHPWRHGGWSSPAE